MKRWNIVLLLLCGVFGMAQIWVSYLRNSNARLLHETQASIIQLQEEIEQLKVEAASLMRPERLRRVAHEQLGMRSPRPTQFLHVPASEEADGP